MAECDTKRKDGDVRFARAMRKLRAGTQHADNSESDGKHTRMRMLCGLGRGLSEAQLCERLRVVTNRVQQLVVRERRDWHAIHALRMRQRMLVRGIVRDTRRKGLQGLQSVLAGEEEIAHAYDTQACGVYIRINILTHCWRYVGKTTNLVRRDQEHLRIEAEGGRGEAAGHLRAAFNATQSDVTRAKYYNFARRHGGVGHWVDIPVRLQVQREAMTPDALARMERVLIRTHGTLNVVGRGTNRGQPVQSVRRRPGPAERRRAAAATHVHALGAANLQPRKPVSMSNVLTTYTDQSTGKVHMCLSAAIASGAETLAVAQGNVCATRWQQLAKQFGPTTLRITHKDGHSVRGRVSDRLLHGRRAATYEPVTEIVVEACRRTEQRDVLMAAAVNLCHTVSGHRQKTQMRGRPFHEVKQIWRLVTRMSNSEAQKIGTANVRQWTTRTWGMSFKTRVAVKVPSDVPAAVAQQVRGAVEATIMCMGDLPPAARRWLVTRVRLVRTRPATVTGMLAAWRKQCQQYDANKEPECTCQHQHALRARGSYKGHVCVRLSEYEGPGKDALQGSCRTTVRVAADRASAFSTAKTCIRDALGGLPIQLQQKLPSMAVYAAMKSINLRECDMHDVEGAVAHHDVLAVKRELQGLVISEIDKARGELCAMCPVVLHHVMAAAWPSDLERENTKQHDIVHTEERSTRYEKTRKTEAEITQDQIRAFEAHNWGRFGKLYGVTKQGKVTTAKLPRVYATIKGKCLPEGGGIVTKLKARPITPHTKVVLKRVYNKVATAYLFVLTQIRQGRVSRLWTTQEYVHRATTEIQRLQKTRDAKVRTRAVM